MLFQNFQTICETIVRGLYGVHGMPFFELRLCLIVVSMIGHFVDGFADGTPHFRAMLVHAFSSGIEIN